MIRKILIAIALLILIFAGTGIYLIHRYDSVLEQNSREVLEKLQPRVITGGEHFDKISFYAGTNLGEITQILVGWPADREGAAITVVGNQGTHFLDSNAGLKKQIRFSKYVGCQVEAVRLNESGEYGFLTRDQSWSVDAILFDKTGQQVWSYPGGALKGIDDSVMGDVSGDGKSKVVIGFNGGGGLVLADVEGKKVWQKAEGNVWHVETLDTRGNGHKEILHSNAQGQLLVRDASGDIIAHYLPGYYVSHFSLTRWGSELQGSHILIPTKASSEGCCKSVFLVLDAGGNTVATLDSPEGDWIHRTKGTPVRYGKDLEFYAVLQTGTLQRSMLSLYNHEGQIKYQEILADHCLGITTLPGKFADRLLVGCTGKVWEYSPKAEADKNGQTKAIGTD
jgi:hypothetical protein